QRARSIAVLAELAQRARDDVVAKPTAGHRLRRATRGIGLCRQCVRQHHEQIEVAVRVGIATRPAAELPDGEWLESEHKPVAQEGERRGFVLERADWSRPYVAEKLADGWLAAFAQKIGHRLKDIPMFRTCPN